VSGGQKQPLAWRAPSRDPSVVVADEPLSHSDMSVQAQVTELLIDIRAGRHHPLFISHDLSVVRYLSIASSSVTLARSWSRGGRTSIYAALSSVYGGTPVGSPDCKSAVCQAQVLLTAKSRPAANPPPAAPSRPAGPYRIWAPVIDSAASRNSQGATHCLSSAARRRCADWGGDWADGPGVRHRSVPLLKTASTSRADDRQCGGSLRIPGRVGGPSFTGAHIR